MKKTLYTYIKSFKRHIMIEAKDKIKVESIEIVNKNPNDLINYEKNNKIHNTKQIDLLANSIQEYWMNSPIVIDSNNIIIAWHGRLEACKKLWLETVPTIQKDNLTPAQVKKYRLLDNKIAELAEDNIENIKFELEELDDIELNELYATKIEDIDFDDINWNEDREVSDKTKNVECPECQHNFSI